MQRHTVIELQKEDFKFAAGHFTIFGPGNREPLHGHNFRVGVSIECVVGEDGFAFDYGIAKDSVRKQCRELNEIFLLPEHSPHLKLKRSGDRIDAVFGEEVIPFLEKDVKVLPVSNITLEELARWFAERLWADLGSKADYRIQKITTRVSSSPGQSASHVVEA